MSLKDIIGQERALKILRGCLTKNRIAHAYLFTGEDGIGKKLTAINFAKTLNCLKPVKHSVFTPDKKENKTPGTQHLSPPPDSCDQCNSCIKIEKAMHPDCFFIAPEDGQIKVATIRGLEESLSYKPFEGKWKIIIIDEADTLNKSAHDAFLKTLEEPPDQSIIMLISSMPDLIPLTIRSRCQKVSFSPLPIHKMGELPKLKYSPGRKDTQNKQPALLSLLSGGRPGWALSRDLIGERDRSFHEFIVLLSKQGEGLWEDRDSMEAWFDWFQLWLRDIAVFKATSRRDLLINLDLVKEIEKISKKAELKDILELSDTLYTIKVHLRFNLNRQITLNYTSLLLKKTFGSYAIEEDRCLR